MSRPRKVPYEEVISAWLRCGDATVVAATLGLGKSTVYKILNRHEYGLLGVDGGEPLALREQKPKPVERETCGRTLVFGAVPYVPPPTQYINGDDFPESTRPAPVAWGEQPRATADKMAALTATPPKPMFFRDGDILTLNDGLLPLMGPGLIERAEEEGFDPTPIAEAYRRLSPDEEDHYVPTPMPTKEEFEAEMERERKKIAARLKALSANLNGKTAAVSNKIAMDRECETAGMARSVVASISTALVVALPVALVAYMVWDWWASL